MASRAKKPQHAAYLSKAPSPVQTEFAAWIEKVTGHAVPSGDVALIQRLYPLYLKTDEVVAAREAAAEARRKAEEEKAAKKREKAQAKLIELEQERFRLRQELGLEPEGEVPDLSVVPATVEPDPEDESTGLVLGEASDEFVEPEPEDDEPAEDPEDEDDLWDEDDDDEEDF